MSRAGPEGGPGRDRRAGGRAGRGAALRPTLPGLALLGILVAGGPVGPGPATAQAQERRRARPPPVYLELPRAEGLPLPPDFEGTRREAARLLGIASLEEMISRSHQGTRPPVEGSQRVLVVPALFADTPEPPVSAASIRDVLFEGPADPGTLIDFYRELSGGHFEVSGGVSPWVRTGVSLERAAGELNGHGFLGDSLAAYVKEAIELADPEVDYGQFDSDGPDGVPNSGDDDGLVDFLVIDHPAVDGSCGGPGPWAHAGGLLTGDADTPFEQREPVPTDDTDPSGDPIRVGAYIGQSALDCTGEEVHTVAVIGHELAHLLGVGDYYSATRGIEPEKRTWLVGCFEIMSAGAWGCGSGGRTARFGPTHMSPYTKGFLGWLEVEEVPPGREMLYELGPSQTTGRALRVPLGPAAPSESFLIEYRPRLGFDRYLPAGGVLVYHLDRRPLGKSAPADLPRPTFYHLVEADGDHALRRVQEDDGNRGVAADVFARDGARDSLTAASSPSSRDHEGETSAVTVHSMEVVGGMARVRLTYEPGFGAVNQDVTSRIRALSPLGGHFEIVGGEGPFQVRPPPGDEFPEDVEFRTEDRLAHLEGRLFRAGFQRFAAQVVDATGQTAETVVALFVFDLPIPREELIEAALDPAAAAELDEETIRYLDLSGYENGEVDIADLRAALERRRLLEDPDGG